MVAAFLDVSTGEFLVAQGDSEYIDKLLQDFSPSEILVCKQQKARFRDTFGEHYHSFFLDDWAFAPDFASQSLNAHFGTASLKGFGIDDLEEGIIASGAVLFYLSETQHDKLKHISAIGRILRDQYVWMDRFTIRNLELHHSYNPGAVTLLDVIDKTISPMGGRLLKRWLALPLKDIGQIRERHEVVEWLIAHLEALDSVRGQIKRISDLERLISKVATGKSGPREVVMLRESLDAIIPIKQLAMASGQPSVRALGEKLQDCAVLREKIGTTLSPDSPVSISKGGAIASGINPELDELRSISNSGNEYLEAIEASE